MCPACITTGLLTPVAASLAGGLTALAWKKLCWKSKRNHQTEETGGEQNANRSNGTQKNRGLVGITRHNRVIQPRLFLGSSEQIIALYRMQQKKRLLLGLLAVTSLGWTSLSSALLAIDLPKQGAMTNDSRRDMITALEAASVSPFVLAINEVRKPKTNQTYEHNKRQSIHPTLSLL